MNYASFITAATINQKRVLCNVKAWVPRGGSYARLSIFGQELDARARTCRLSAGKVVFKDNNATRRGACGVGRMMLAAGGSRPSGGGVGRLRQQVFDLVVERFGDMFTEHELFGFFAGDVRFDLLGQAAEKLDLGGIGSAVIRHGGLADWCGLTGAMRL